MNNVEKRIKEILAEYNRIKPESISCKSEFLYDLDMDSIERMDALVLFENEFKVIIDDDEAGGIKSVGEVIALIEAKLKNIIE